MRWECTNCGAHGFSPGTCLVCTEGRKRPLAVQSPPPLGVEPFMVEVCPAPRKPRFARVRRVLTHTHA
jgi:hypothetical protein